MHFYTGVHTIILNELLYATLQAEGPLTVTGLLNSLGLEKYLVLFQAEEVIFDYIFICLILFKYFFSL